MEWLIISGLVLYIYYKGVVKAGNVKFWKLTRAHPNSAYQLFTSSPAWYVCDGNSDAPIDMKNWNGPFRFLTPDGRTVKIYGKFGEFKKLKTSL